MNPLLTKLDAVVEMAAKATAGPWFKMTATDNRHTPLVNYGGRAPSSAVPTPEDAQFIASARQLVPALARMVKGALLAIEGAPHEESCAIWEPTYRNGAPEFINKCTCWCGTALATLTQEIERLKV